MFETAIIILLKCFNKIKTNLQKGLNYLIIGKLKNIYS
jgi:hypothetical protein